MNSVKFQDIKSINRNLWHFYRLITNHQKRNFKNPIYNSTKKNKLVGNKFNQEVEKPIQLKTKTLMKETKINGKTSHVHGLKHLVMLR